VQCDPIMMIPVDVIATRDHDHASTLA